MAPWLSYPDNLLLNRMERCRVPREDACGCLLVKTAVRTILFDKKTPIERTEFNASINGTLFW
jgi:hypothetical protein